MRISVLPSLCIAVLGLLCTQLSTALADEKGDALLKKTLAATDAACPLVAELTAVTHWGDFSNTDTRRYIQIASGSSIYSGLSASENGQQIPAALFFALPVTLTDPLPIQNSVSRDHIPTTARYLGVETVQGVAYEVLEVKDWFAPKEDAARFSNLEYYKLTGGTAKWYIGADSLIHRISASLQFEVTNSNKPRKETVQIDGVVTTFRKPIIAAPRATAGPPVLKIPDTGMSVMEPIVFLTRRRQIFCKYMDGTGSILDSSTGREIQKWKGLMPNVRLLIPSADCSLLAISNFTDGIEIRDAATGQVLHTLKTHTQTLVFSPDNTRLATNSEGAIRIWDIGTGQPVQSLERSESVAIAFSPDGKWFASANSIQGFTTHVTIWDTTLWQARNFDTKSERRSGLVFSPDSRLLAVGGSSVLMWEVAPGKALPALQGGGGDTKSLAFSPDGKRMIALDRDLRGDIFSQHPGVTIWDVSNAKLLSTQDIPFRGPSQNATLSPDGGQIAFISRMAGVQIWEIPPISPPAGK